MVVRGKERGKNKKKNEDKCDLYVLARAASRRLGFSLFFLFFFFNSRLGPMFSIFFFFFKMGFDV